VQLRHPRDALRYTILSTSDVMSSKDQAAASRATSCNP
jgi:hypothetical protein